MYLKYLILAFCLIACTVGEEEVKEKAKDDDERIIGGRMVGDRTRHPYIAAMQIAEMSPDGILNYQTICGCSIIKPNWVITASHCIKGIPWQLLTVVAGIVIDNDVSNPHMQRSAVAEVNWHPFYFGYRNDIGLVRLATPFKFSQFISPIKLAPPNYVLTATEGVISGWGRSNDTGEMKPSRILKEAKVKLHDCSQCQQLGLVCIDDIHVCIGDPGNTACQGDSGGPLVVDRHLYGITGHGTTTCVSHAVYTKVQAYPEFIDAVFKGAEEREKKVVPNIYGRAAFINEMPHLLSIHSVGSRNPSFRRKRCSGVALGYQWVVTAAHCMETDETIEGKTQFYVIAGSSTAFPEQENTVQIARVLRVFIPSTYKKGTHRSDIAVLFIESLYPTVAVQPVTFINRLGFPVGDLTAVGYRLTQEAQEPNNIFLENVTLAEKHICAEFYTKTIGPDQMCINSQSNVFCDRDTGGPVFIKNSAGGWILEGITSAQTRPCNIPQIYTRISDFINWIYAIFQKVKQEAEAQANVF